MFHRESLLDLSWQDRVVQMPVGNDLDRCELVSVPESAQRDSTCLSYVRRVLWPGTRIALMGKS